jgi:hypothetical protein
MGGFGHAVLEAMRVAKRVIQVAVAGLLLWANSRTGSGAVRTRLKPPDELWPLGKELFYRGWPLSPWMVCSFHGGRWHPEEDFIWLTLVYDAVIAVLLILVLSLLIDFSQRICRCWTRWKTGKE